MTAERISRDRCNKKLEETDDEADNHHIIFVYGSVVRRM